MRRSSVYNQGFVVLWRSEKPKLMLTCVEILLPLLKVIALQTIQSDHFSLSHILICCCTKVRAYINHTFQMEVLQSHSSPCVTLCFCIVSIIASFLLGLSAAAVPVWSLCSTLKNTWLPHLIDFLPEICKHLISTHNLHTTSVISGGSTLGFHKSKISRSVFDHSENDVKHTVECIRRGFVCGLVCLW